MKFSVAAFIIVVSLVVISGFASYREGTLMNKKVTMGFLNHGGMWGDLILMSVVSGSIFPYFLWKRALIFFVAVSACAFSIIAHVKWARGFREEGITGHMFPAYKNGTWYKDISNAGWMHVGVMSLLLSGTFMYAASPIPEPVILLVSVLLTAHVFLGTLQPGWFCSGELWRWSTLVPPLFATGLIWIIAMLKIQFSRP
jgi:hypothetical protein